MRNLKKFLALVLAMVMAFSLMLTASAANGDYDKYNDKDSVTAEFVEAVKVLTGLDVMAGDQDAEGKSQFRPGDTITRAEAAAVIYRVATGDVASDQVALYADYNHFTDVNSGDWFAGYVGFCQNAGYIKGKTPTTFRPYDKVTGYEMLAMLLRVVGYGKNNEFTGGEWQVNVAALAESLHITDIVKEAHFSSTLNMAAPREVVAALTFVTMTEVPTVTFTTALSYNDKQNVTSSYYNPTIGQKIFGLWKGDEMEVDQWGRPGYRWYQDGIWQFINGDPVYNANHPVFGGSTGSSYVVAEIAKTPVLTYTKRIAECDIAHDLEFDGTRNIEAAYIDGVKYPVTDDGVTTNCFGTINSLATTSYIGGNGRITEVYAMSGAYRLVEINTYLAQVKEIVPEYTDRNNHVIPAYARLEVYVKSDDVQDADGLWQDQKTTWDGILQDNDLTGAAGTGDDDYHGATGTDGSNTGANPVTLYTSNVSNAVGSYVLVTASGTSVTKTLNSRTGLKTGLAVSVKAADIANGGNLNRWTVGAGLVPGTTTLGSNEPLNDADKFVLNRRSTAVQAWNAALDEYGNVIGLVTVTANALVIEKIEWKHGAEGIGTGKAIADVVLSDGSKLSGVTIASVTSRNAAGTEAITYPTTNTTDTVGLPGYVAAPARVGATVSDYYTNNTAYYNHIFNYTLNADGSYALSVQTDNTDGTVDHDTNKPIDVTTGTITSGQATIHTGLETYVATENTIFLVKNKTGDIYTYTVYTGKDNVPSMTNATLCILTNSANYATLVVASDYAMASNTFLAYVGDAVQDVYGNPLGLGYDVYKLGETTTTTLFERNTASPVDFDTTYSASTTGLYRFTVNSNNQIDSMTLVLDDSKTDGLTGGGYGGPTGLVNDSRHLARLAVTATHSGTSFQTKDFSSFTSDWSNAANVNGYTLTPTSFYRDFNVNSDTQIVVVEKNGTDKAATATVLRAGTASDITVDSEILVVYDQKTSVDGSTYYADAKVVYVITKDWDGANINVPATTGAVKYTVNIYQGGVLIGTRSATSAKAAAGTVWPSDWATVQANYAAFSTLTWDNVIVDHPGTSTIVAGQTIELVYSISVD